jgi:3-deoxy-D-manno-octulosonic-acid transferase
MMLSFFIGLYSMGISVICILGKLLTCISPRFSSWEIDKRSVGPILPANIPQTERRIWIHGASLGEVRLIPKLLSILDHKHPSDTYVLTATTKTGLHFLQTLKNPSIKATGYFPFDTVLSMKKFLRVSNFSRIWILETEIWPSLLYCCKKLSIPIGCINGRIEEKSLLRYKQFRWFIAPLLATFNPVLVQSEVYAARYEYCGARKETIKVFPNLKSIITIQQIDQDKKNRLREKLCISPTDLVLTAGCVHPGEGLILRRAAEFLKNRGVKITCILVPRHLKASKVLLSELDSDAKLFDSCNAKESFSMCIINQMGILEDMYSLADAAFVGGTFVSIGGHNMWNAAQFGIPVFFGPHYQTQYESCKTLQDARIGFLTGGAEGIAQGILTHVVNNPGKSAFKKASTTFAESLNNKISDLGPFLP